MGTSPQNKVTATFGYLAITLSRLLFTQYLTPNLSIESLQLVPHWCPRSHCSYFVSQLTHSAEEGAGWTQKCMTIFVVYDHFCTSTAAFMCMYVYGWMDGWMVAVVM